VQLSERWRNRSDGSAIVLRVDGVCIEIALKMSATIAQLWQAEKTQFISCRIVTTAKPWAHCLTDVALFKEPMALLKQNARY